MNEDKLLIAQAEDLIARCGRQDIPVCSEFLDARQQSLLRRAFGEKQGDVTIAYFGGYEDADRVVMACLPYYMVDSGGMGAMDSDAFESTTMFETFLSVIRATVPKNSQASAKGRALIHGDYLGALMGLGVRRSVIGDILVREDGADIIVLEDMAEYLKQNLGKAGRAYISTEIVPLPELLIPEKETTTFTDTVASLRLDAVLASAFRISRSRAAEEIKKGLVFVDYLEATKPDMTVDEGARLVIRHMGKARLAEVGRRTRKDRISIVIER